MVVDNDFCEFAFGLGDAALGFANVALGFAAVSLAFSDAGFATAGRAGTGAARFGAAAGANVGLRVVLGIATAYLLIEQRHNQQ